MPSSKPDGGDTPVPPTRTTSDAPVDMTDLESVFGKMLEMVDAIEPVDVVSAKIDDEAAQDPPTNPTRANLEFVEVLRVIHSDTEESERNQQAPSPRRESARNHLSVVRNSPELSLTPGPPPVRSVLDGDDDAEDEEEGPTMVDDAASLFGSDDDAPTIEEFSDPPSVEDPDGWLDNDDPTETPAPVRSRHPGASRIGEASKDAVDDPSLQSFTDVGDGPPDTEEVGLDALDTDDAPTEETPPVREFASKNPRGSRIDSFGDAGSQVPPGETDSRSAVPWLLVLGIVLALAVLGASIATVLFLT